MQETTVDHVGTPVAVGTVVRVLKVPESVLARLSAHDQMRVASMHGETFEVYEVDGWGGAWVKKWWQEGQGKGTSHSLGLKPEEFEVVVGIDSRARKGA